MSASPADPAPAQPTIPLDPATFGATLSTIVTAAVNDHMRWNQGFLEWCNHMMANFQPVAPQANMDFLQRQQGILQFLQSFAAPAAMLKSAGEPGFAAALDHYADGFNKLLGTFNATHSAMAADNIATSNAITASMSNIAATNAAAGAERAKLATDTFAETFRVQGDAMAAQRASFEAMTKKWMGTI